MRFCGLPKLSATALVVATVALVSPRDVFAQMCASPNLEVSTSCPSGILVATFTAIEEYSSATVRIFESGSMIFITELDYGPIGLGEQFFLATSLPNGTYQVDAEAGCVGGGIVVESQTVTISCSALSLATTIAEPYTSAISAATIGLSQLGARAASVLQNWSGPSFDVSDFVLSSVQGFVTMTGPPNLELSMELVVVSVSSSSATLDCVVTSVSPDFLDLITSLGASDPTGAPIGSVTITEGSFPGLPQIAIDIPDPFPPGSMWVPTLPLELNIVIDTAFIDLPPAPSFVTVTSDVTAIDGLLVTFIEDIYVDAPPVLYNPEIDLQLSTTAAGATATFIQTITDPAGSRITVEAVSDFDAGSFLLTPYGVGESIGDWRIDLMFVPQVLTGQIVVSNVGGTLLETNLIADSIHPVALSLLGSLGLPNPIGTAVYALDYENLVGGGVRVHLHDHSIFPLGATVPVIQDLALVIEHQVGLTLPAAGGSVTIDSTLMSQFGEFVLRNQTIPISGGVGGSFERGDCNGDSAFDIGDAIFTLSALFSGGTLPTCADACDSNDDGSNDIGDAIYSLTALFAGGLLPGPPGASCGLDPTADALGCVASPCP
ncbi:MAG: hypothetical protein ACKVX7_17340 [Planctomycetota bacterium]